MASHALARLVRDAAVRVLDSMPALQHKLRTEMSETDITYRSGPLVALGGSASHRGRGGVGTRALEIAWLGDADDERRLWPLLNDRHTLLVFSDGDREQAPAAARAAPHAAAVQTIVIGMAADPQGDARRRYGLDAAGWVLIRPDMVIAARGAEDDVAVLERYLQTVIARNAV
jgi:hypothetical protein